MSGPYRCSKKPGHTDECETTAPATPWVGPAALPFRHVSRGQHIGAEGNVLPNAKPTLGQDRVSGASAVTRASDPDGPQEGA
jgi:hypothetical protein